MKKFECVNCGKEELILSVKYSSYSEKNSKGFFSYLKSSFSNDIFECKFCHCKYIIDKEGNFSLYLIDQNKKKFNLFENIRSKIFKIKFSEPLIKLILFTLFLILITSINLFIPDENSIKGDNGVKLEFVPSSIVGEKNYSKQLYGFLYNKGKKIGYCTSLKMELWNNENLIDTKNPSCFFSSVEPSEKVSVSFFLQKEEVGLEKKFVFKNSEFLDIKDNLPNLKVKSSKFIIEDFNYSVIMNIINEDSSPAENVKANVILFNKEEKVCSMSHSYSNIKILEPGNQAILKIEKSMDYCKPERYEIEIAGQRYSKN